MLQNELSTIYPNVSPESLNKTLPIAYKWAENFNILPEKQDIFVQNYLQMVFYKKKVWFRSVIHDNIEYFLGCVNDIYILWDGYNVYYFKSSTCPTLHQLKEKVRLSENDIPEFLNLVKEIKYAFANYISEKTFNPWKLLRKNDSAMRVTLTTIAEQDKASLFHNTKGKELSFSQQTRMQEGFRKNRVSYYGKIVDYILFKIRSLIPKEIVSTLWFLHLHDARYAHWILSAKTSESRLYRIQALRTQSLMLPLVLSKFYAFYSIKPKQCHSKELSVVQNYTTINQHAAKNKLMTEAIDGGKSWQEHLLSCVEVVFYFFKEGSESLSKKSFEMVIKKSTKLKPNSFLSLPYMFKSNHMYSVKGWFHIAVGLQMGERQPKSRKEWIRFLNFSAWCLPSGDEHCQTTKVYCPSKDELEQYPSKARQAIETYIKTTPVRWSDDYWSFLDNTYFSNTFSDTVRWICKSKNKDLRMGSHLLQKNENESFSVFSINLNRLLNINHDLHEQQRRVLDEIDEIMLTKYGKDISIEWNLGLPSTQWIHKNLTIVELTNQYELIDEGKNMNHCVGGYASSCCSGTSRIYSVRDLTKKTTLSTFELRAKMSDTLKRNVVQLVQNQAIGNTKPQESAQKAVQAFMRIVNSKKNKLNYNFYWPSVNKYQEIQKEKTALFDERFNQYIQKINI